MSDEEDPHQPGEGKRGEGGEGREEGPGADPGQSASESCDWVESRASSWRMP